MLEALLIYRLSDSLSLAYFYERIKNNPGVYNVNIWDTVCGSETIPLTKQYFLEAILKTPGWNRDVGLPGSKALDTLTLFSSFQAVCSVAFGLWGYPPSTLVLSSDRGQQWGSRDGFSRGCRWCPRLATALANWFSTPNRAISLLPRGPVKPCLHSCPLFNTSFFFNP